MHKSIIVNLFKSVVNLRNQKKWQLSNFFGREEMHKSIYSKSVTSVVNLRNQKKWWLQWDDFVQPLHIGKWSFSLLGHLSGLRETGGFRADHLDLEASISDVLFQVW